MDLIKGLRFATTERIRKEYMKRFDTISWITIKRHLEALCREKLIEKEILSKGKVRTIVLFKSKQ